MPDTITTLRVGVPGASGANVSAAEKATYVTLTGANTFTNTNFIRKTSSAALTVSNDAAAATYFRVDTSAGSVNMLAGADLRGFSDTGTTETYSIDGATGNIQTDGTLTVDGGSIKGELLWLAFEIDGGGSALTTGTKRRWKIPYNCQIVSDGTAAWEVLLEPSGSIGLDLWMDTYTNLPVTSADRISGTLGSNNPRVTGAIKAQSATLTNWTIDLVKGRYLYIDINSITTSTWATLSLHVKKT